jgi:hypothetical protein
MLFGLWWGAQRNRRHLPNLSQLQVPNNKFHRSLEAPRIEEPSDSGGTKSREAFFYHIFTCLSTQETMRERSKYQAYLIIFNPTKMALNSWQFYHLNLQDLCNTSLETRKSSLQSIVYKIQRLEVPKPRRSPCGVRPFFCNTRMLNYRPLF